MTAAIDWEPIRNLARHVLDRGESLVLTQEVCALLRRSAEEVALSLDEAEMALREESTAMTLLREVRRRIREGSDRLDEASSQADRLMEEGDLDGAAQPFLDALVVEVVPLYRQRLENELRTLARLQTVAASGQVDPKVNDWVQLPALVLRVRRSLPLELTEDLRAYVQRAAASAALDETETQAALTSPERTGPLLEKVLRLRLEGSERTLRVLHRMFDLEDAGDVPGARQLLLETLAVEVIPTCRRMLEENRVLLDRRLSERLT